MSNDIPTRAADPYAPGDAPLEGRRRNRSRTVAKLITDLFSPFWLIIALLAAVSASSTRNVPSFLLWWIIPTLFTSLLPAGFVLQAKRQGRVSDWHVTRAAERALPFAVAILSFAAGAAVMLVLSAPQAILAVTLAAMAGLFVALAVTPWYKLSVHTASVTGTVMIVGLVFGWWALAVAPLVPLVGWARIRIADHTLGQVVTGAVVGAAVAAAGFTVVMAGA